ncbi:MAG: hypothetical protein LBH82_03350 [Bacteroidales bacterium]|jgi:hypothetical protein|nr:hypothetical protein [Bacteroidales bacterium]
MRTYNFKAANRVVFILMFTFLFMGVSVLSAFTLLIKEIHIILSILFISGGVFFSIYIIRITSLAKVEVTIEDDAISIKWLEKFLFGNKPDITIYFNDIAAYVDQSDTNWNWLKIEMKDGSIYKIWQSDFFFNDDYHEFISAFISAVENHNIVVENSSEKDNLSTIKRAKSIYETTGGLILAGFAIVIMVGFPISLVVFPSTKEPNYFLLLLGYSGSIYFVFQVYTKRKGNNKKDKQ